MDSIVVVVIKGRVFGYRDGMIVFGYRDDKCLGIAMIVFGYSGDNCLDTAMK